MSNENHAHHPTPTARRSRRIWRIVPGVLLSVIFAGIFARPVLPRETPSADERLAEIEAARAVPDAENAALIYNELFEDPHAMSLLDACPDVPKGPLFEKRLDEPWRSEDCPELAAWIDECAPVLDKLVKASQRDACRFPVSIDLVISQKTMDRRHAMRQSAYLVLFSVNKDLGEGRLDTGVTKWRCLVQLANHRRQQPLLIDHMEATALTKLTLKSIARFVATGEPSARDLQAIEAMPLPLADDWQQHLQQIRIIDDLIEQKTKESLGCWDRITYPIASYRMKRAMKKAYAGQKDSPADSTGKWYRQNITVARGLHILIALRRHHHQTGQWPERLDQIKSALSEEILADPLNGGSFVYMPTQETFKLYSKGPNNIDEDGRTEPDADDWPIWPPAGKTAPE